MALGVLDKGEIVVLHLASDDTLQDVAIVVQGRENVAGPTMACTGRNYVL